MTNAVSTVELPRNTEYRSNSRRFLFVSAGSDRQPLGDFDHTLQQEDVT